MTLVQLFVMMLKFILKKTPEVNMNVVDVEIKKVVVAIGTGLCGLTLTIIGLTSHFLNENKANPAQYFLNDTSEKELITVGSAITAGLGTTALVGSVITGTVAFKAAKKAAKENHI
ncbi:MAG: hypothetical protein ACRCXZ_09060 [Patescibacteria group bacterium]